MMQELELLIFDNRTLKKNLNQVLLRTFLIGAKYWNEKLSTDTVHVGNFTLL